MFCLPAESVKKLKEAIKKGEFNPEKLNGIKDSTERRNFLEKIVGKEQAQEVNLLFEKKLLLKNQEKAMYDFGREITGLSKADKEATLAKIRATYADKNNRLFDPKENEAFLNEITSDIYSKKYRTEIDLEEAQTITELASDVKKKKALMNPDFTWPTKQDGINYGAAQVALENYVGGLKLEAQKRPLVNVFKEEGGARKAAALLENAKVSTNFIADNSMSMIASVDNSLWFRQGLPALTNPKYSKIWLKNFGQSWKDIAKTIKKGKVTGDEILDAVRAELYSRKNYLNGRYKLGSKLDIGTGEEQYPTSFPSRIYALGRVFKASEVAYEAGAMRLRADIADVMFDLAEKSGIDLLDKEEVGSINKVVNSMTGRGKLPTGEGLQAAINKVFFSIKKVKSDIDFLLLHPFGGDKLKPFARQQAGKNLLSYLTAIGVTMGIARALSPKKNRDIFDPRSSNFGKLKLGKYMTLDLSGGKGAYLVLAAKILSQQTKSATTGIVSKLGQGYGSDNGMDVLWKFTENKFSPIFGVIRDLIRQKDFDGNTPTALSILKNLTTPISVSNTKLFKVEKAAIALIGLIADAVGISANAFPPKADWGENTGKELLQFKEKVGTKRFEEANNKYNERFEKWFSTAQDNKKYQELSDEDKQKLITKQKAEIKEKVFKEYNFKYKPEKEKKLPKISELLKDVIDPKDFKLVKDVYASDGLGDEIKSRKELLTRKVKLANFFENLKEKIPTIYDDKIIDKLASKYGFRRNEITTDETRKIYQNMIAVREADPKWYFDNISLEDEKDMMGFEITSEKLKNELLPEEKPIKAGLEGEPDAPEQQIKTEATLEPTAEPVKKKESFVEKIAEKLSGDKVKGTSDLARNPEIKRLKIDKNVKSSIEKAADKYGVPSQLLFDIALQESHFDAGTVNMTEAGKAAGNPTGLYQFTDATWDMILNTYNNKKGMSLKLPNTNRADPETNAMAAAYLIKNGQLGKWDASEDVWGKYWTPDELEEMGFYKQSMYHKKGIRPSVRLAKKD